ncbi:hypothetical protein GEV33_013165 [Tenebrio molitor]|jgi:hypothetical protein|uniref:Uncharacterized protein n=1 Tax=Tenebrio molitor TaxID=7067 RepID=A0A8J6H8E7_TENMO|nr:hypothetical protein GEV33_013165 [Tenebrio molitor]
MLLQVFCVLAVGLLVDGTTGQKVPEFIHHHTNYALYDDYKAPKKQTKGQQYDNNNPYEFQPVFDKGYQKSWKTLRTEKYETETVDNPQSDSPFNKYIVKSRVKVTQKLPYQDEAVGYDRQYEYPTGIMDHDHQKNEDFVDYYNAKNDPFQKERDAELPRVKDDLKEEKPKQYHYQYPTNDLEYLKNLNTVNFYLAHNKPDPIGSLFEEPQKAKDYGHNDVDYDPSPVSEKYRLDHGGPDEYSYDRYKTDGPTFDYLGDYSHTKEERVPSKS